MSHLVEIVQAASFRFELDQMCTTATKKTAEYSIIVTGSLVEILLLVIGQGGLRLPPGVRLVLVRATCG